MDLIGGGEMEPRLREMILENDLSDCVHLLGVMPPEEVRRHMECAGIFLMTSDRKEGWGAVLNEAMNSGCAVVASDAAGSVPFLLKNGENGFSFHSGDSAELFEKTRVILKQPALAAALGEAAYETISTTWNADLAAERFLALAEQALKGETRLDLFTEGPCSKAKLLADNWM
jgi:glycosyltransferase involved in cell wall biosynthesis